MDHYILFLQHLSTHMRFITNGYKRFSKTNSPDPRQRAPLSDACVHTSWKITLFCKAILQLNHFKQPPNNHTLKTTLWFQEKEI